MKAETYERSILTLAILSLLLSLAFAASAFGTVAAVKVSPDGLWRVEVADYRQRQVFELWATPSVGGTRRQIGQRVPALSDVRNDFIISPDSRRVVYVQGETASGSNFRLWSTSIDRMDGRVVSHQPAQLGVGFDFPIRTACGGRYVEFRSDPVVDEQYATYQVSFDGVMQPCVLFIDGFESGNQGGWQ